MEFKSLKDYPNKEISLCGKIRTASGKYLRGQIAKGYHKVSIRVGGILHTKFVHRLLWETWVDKIPEGMYINHIDGNKLNNSISNLEVVTQKENNIHALRTGLRKLTYTNKISEQDVIYIRDNSNFKVSTLASRFNLTRQQIHNIIKHKSWSNIC